jgi:hypothetical protein
VTRWICTAMPRVFLHHRACVRRGDSLCVCIGSGGPIRTVAFCGIQLTRLECEDVFCFMPKHAVFPKTSVSLP